MNRRSNTPLQAFAAMAIGRTETDHVYDRLIKPALASVNISARRVDRIEHNDDIDDRIMAELQDCDLLIADLTYARPSVYFEAGYAQGRGTPVIYTCRRDHLSGRSDDLRVHFDLQMKPIIPWKHPDDQIFPKALVRRARKVVAPMVRERQIEAEQHESERKFSSLSLDQRAEQLLQISAKALSEAGFSVMEFDLQLDHGRSIVHLLEATDLMTTFKSGKLARRWQRGGILWTIVVWAGATPKKDLFESINHLVAANRMYSMGPKGAFQRTPRQLVESFIICALRKVPRERIAMALPQFHREATSTYSFQTQQIWPYALDSHLERVVPARHYRQNISAPGPVAFEALPRGVDAIENLYLQNGKLVNDARRTVAKIVSLPRAIHVHFIDGRLSPEGFDETFRLILKQPLPRPVT